MPRWKPEKYVGFDWETSGTLPEYALQPWRMAQGKMWPTSLVWIEGRKAHGGVLHRDPDLPVDLTRCRDAAEQMLDHAIRNERVLVGWNTVYDISICLALGLDDLVFKCRWLDGMLLWRHAFIEPEYDETGRNRKSYGLKTCVAELLPEHADYAEDVDFHDASRPARAKLHAYNIRDVTFTLHCTAHWMNQLDDRQWRAAQIEAESLPLIARANLHGMVVDTLVCRELSQFLLDRSNALMTKLTVAGMPDAEITVRSPAKLAKYLYDDLGLPVLKENTGKKTGKVTRATDKEVLHELAFINPRARDIREYREALNNRTKFAEGPLTAVEYNEDGRAHPLAIPFGTYSGRLTYASKQGRNKDERPIGFALHQEKRAAEFRDIIVPPDGYTLMEFDASGQEFRWMAIASEDPVMLSLCAPGEDPHGFMGARIEQLDYDWIRKAVKEGDPRAKSARQLGKVGNLSLQYRTSARKLRVVARVQYDLPMELPQAELIHRTYPATYQRVPIYWQKQKARTQRLGYVETFAGRRVQVRGDWNGSQGWSMHSTAINYPIQGTGADQKYLALAVLKPYLTKIGAYFAWDLHDGIYLFVPNRHVKAAAVEIKRRLDNLPYQQAWGFTPPIAMPWDCKIGMSWGTLREYEFD